MAIRVPDLTLQVCVGQGGREGSGENGPGLDEREQDWPPSTTALVKKSEINKTLKRKEVRIVTGQRKVKSGVP